MQFGWSIWSPCLWNTNTDKLNIIMKAVWIFACSYSVWPHQKIQQTCTFTEVFISIYNYMYYALSLIYLNQRSNCIWYQLDMLHSLLTYVYLSPFSLWLVNINNKVINLYSYELALDTFVVLFIKMATNSIGNCYYFYFAMFIIQHNCAAEMMPALHIYIDIY